MTNIKNITSSTINASPPAGDPGGPLDKAAFAEKLADAIALRRSKTVRFLSDEQVEAVFDDCLAIRVQGKTTKSVEMLRRMVDNGGFLCVAGNLADLLQMLGFSRDDWDLSKEGVVAAAPESSSALKRTWS